MTRRPALTTESALAGGMVFALLWGIGVSLRGLVLGAHDITWLQWMTQLVAGVLFGLVVPPAAVRGMAWIADLLEHRQTLHLPAWSRRFFPGRSG